VKRRTFHKNPSTIEGIRAIGDTELASRGRLILDSSALTAFSSEAANTLPLLQTSLLRVQEDALKSVYDMSSAYHQLWISRKLNRYFGFCPECPESQLWVFRRLSQGWSSSPSLASWCFRTILDCLNAVLLGWSVDKALKEVTKIHEGEPPAGWLDKVWIFLLSIYLDDIFLQTPLTKLDRYDLTESSYFRPPRTAEDEAPMLHLACAKKLMRVLRKANLLCSPRKCQILVSQSF
jgi:hypothetical protein